MTIKRAFQPEIISVNLRDITLIKTMTAAFRKTPSYRRIAASMEHVGLIEPLVVFPAPKGVYVLLDGHTRYDILSAAGTQTANCLLATDNEGYTYNRRVNHIPPIAQHHMILRALEHVTEERIASALNVSVAAIREKRDLLQGICPEATDILRNERVSAAAFCALRKMKPVRQIDVARLMMSASKFSGRFARVLLDGTRDEFLVPAPTVRRPRLNPDQQTLFEQETNELLQHAESIKANYGEDVLKLTAASKYIERLLSHARIRRYLAKSHEHTLSAIEQILHDLASDKRRRSTLTMPGGDGQGESSASANCPPQS